jgi:hypothetical protein
MRFAGISWMLVALLVLNLSCGLFCHNSVQTKTTPTSSEFGSPHFPAELRIDADNASAASPQLSPDTIVPALRSINASDNRQHDGFAAARLTHVGGDLLQLQHVLRI